ncbi:Lrp/AsnC family transcriptional regulator [Paraglaciecola polaris]|uniref:Leucine-responsive regulatory protein n=1 Tax=Paraglaciecola polaris LMG 21857 TaxID=1129793 RepID=K6YKU5_9ALTE|nr:Lrp/AsnC family transcriptional regulator [Paraglaciecola polaris]GAC33304.1 leucine-responsive regulatory protein [Paraglaciecola polaris LMG 21857]|tara:strand:- start:1396 stop:1866 length:471 start_codon:yes stop_codon:yes gene_type:complete
MDHIRLDRYETRILETLQEFGRISNVELAKKVGLSDSPSLRKTKHLEDTGIIEGYRAIVNPKKVGCHISALVMINLDQNVVQTEDFFNQIKSEKRVIECLAITGSADVMLKVVAKDIEDLTALTFDGLLRHPCVKDISSCVVLKEIKKHSPMPILS